MQDKGEIRVLNTPILPSFIDANNLQPFINEELKRVLKGIGEPHLERQLISVITLMNISETWNEFLKLFGKKFQKDLILLSEHTNFKKSTPKKITGQQYLFEDEETPSEPQEPAPATLFNHTLKGVLSVPPPQKDK